MTKLQVPTNSNQSLVRHSSLQRPIFAKEMSRRIGDALRCVSRERDGNLRARVGTAADDNQLVALENRMIAKRRIKRQHGGEKNRKHQCHNHFIVQLYNAAVSRVKEIASVIEEEFSPLFDNFTALPRLRGRGADQKRSPIDIANAV